jgi:EmrB/QacA subfamily drug resistance transporter
MSLCAVARRMNGHRSGRRLAPGDREPADQTGTLMSENHADPAAPGPAPEDAAVAAGPARRAAEPAHHAAGQGLHAAGPGHQPGSPAHHATPAHHHAASGGPARGNKWWTLTAVCLGTFMLLLDVTIVNVALPDIQDALHSSFSGLQWVVDAYALSLAALLLTAGSLADRFGRRRLYLVGLVIFTLGSLLCGVAVSSLMLQLSRGLQGVGGAAMFAVGLALLADAFRGKDRGVAFGVWGAITGLAVAIGPLLGGLLTSGLSWRWIFFVNLPIGVVALVISVLKVTESRAPAAHRPDWLGFVLFTAALSALVYGLIESSQRSFGSGLVLGCLIGAGVLLIAFVVAEARLAHPMFELALFRKPTFSGGSFAAFSLSASIFALLLYLVLYVQDVLGYSALGTGVRLLVISGGTLATSTIAGRLSSRVPVRLLIGPGMLLVGVGLLLMRGLDAGSSWTHLILGMAIGGAGVGLVNPPLASTAVGVVPPQQAGMASGINSTFRQVGIATGIALLGTLFSSQLKDYVAAHAAGLSGHGPQLAAAIQSGGLGSVLRQLPPAARPAAEHLAAAAFTSGLNAILLVAAIIALAGGVVGLAAIRSRDFAH